MLIKHGKQKHGKRFRAGGVNPHVDETFSPSQKNARCSSGIEGQGGSKNIENAASKRAVSTDMIKKSKILKKNEGRSHPPARLYLTTGREWSKKR